MRKFVLAVAAVAAVGLALPLTTPASADTKVVIKSGPSPAASSVASPPTGSTTVTLPACSRCPCPGEKIATTFVERGLRRLARGLRRDRLAAGPRREDIAGGSAFVPFLRNSYFGLAITWLPYGWVRQ